MATVNLTINPDEDGCIVEFNIHPSFKLESTKYVLGGVLISAALNVARGDGISVAGLNLKTVFEEAANGNRLFICTDIVENKARDTSKKRQDWFANRIRPYSADGDDSKVGDVAKDMIKGGVDQILSALKLIV